MIVCGALGGTGVYFVQIAKILGATVTAVASARNGALLRSLGADEVIDYAAERYADADADSLVDIVVDTAGTTTFGEARRVLKPGGRFVPLEFTGREMLHALRSSLSRGPKVLLSVSGDKREDLEWVAREARAGHLKPVADSLFSLDDIRDAHRRVETRHKTGAVVLTMRV